ARAPGAAGGGVSAAPVSERGGAPERATLEAATPAAPAFADGVDRAPRAGRRAATLPRARERRVAARADGPRRDPRQLPVVRAGGGRASRARAPESDGARLAGAGDGGRSSLAPARRRRGARGGPGRGAAGVGNVGAPGAGRGGGAVPVRGGIGGRESRGGVATAGSTVSITSPSLDPGWWVGDVVLDADELRADDRRLLVWRVAPPVR